jgi:hypothetical protein
MKGGITETGSYCNDVLQTETESKNEEVGDSCQNKRLRLN